VTTAVPIAIFVGYYQDPANGLNAAALDVAGFLDVLPEIRVPPEQLKAVLGNRMGAIAGVMLAEKYGWRIGDRIPIKSSLWMHQQTGQDWVFELEAIANAGPDDNKTFAQELYFHYDYLDQARATGQGRVNQFILGIDDSDQAQRLAQEVDALFANSSDETITMNEKQYLQSNLRRLGDVESFVYYILSAVLFSLLFMTATNMVQAIRERTSELGIMRAIGFQGRELALLIGAESAVLCLVGATLGLALAGGLFPSVFANFGFQGVSLGGGVYLQGLGIALGLAMVASAWPAWRAATLKVVDAIAGEGRR
jgi:putative ABC transport system permease protein